MILFNCPQWQTGLDAIEISRLAQDGNKILHQMRTEVSEVSCDTLINVCISLDNRAQFIRLSLYPSSRSFYVHLAAFNFYDSSHCQATTDPATTIESTTETQTPPLTGMCITYVPPTTKITIRGPLSSNQLVSVIGRSHHHCDHH